ncbi:MAG: glyoxylate/hydroxypyruvate reductase A [Burkholderiaceae bacterium]|jgi:glyoxylate/hydroxypyruvate reductase A|nr:glyoxylate/hydroxypyruvate reductase A [Burkholderiaceae bacterium]
MRVTFCCDDTRPDAWLQGLRTALPDAEVDIWAPGSPQADYALVWAPPQRFIDEQPGLKAMFNIGAGVDALLPLCLPPGLPVYRLEDAGMAVQMAEYVCQAVIRFFRGLDGYEADMAQGLWQHRPNPRRADCPVGVMGLGRMGERVARTLTVFDFPVNGWSRTPHAIDGVRGFSGTRELDAFLAGTRVLVNLLPLTPDTENIIDARSLGLLRSGAYVINVGRGGHVVDEDLVAAIDGGHVSGALLDVFRTEPLPEGHPFWAHPRITLTPHTSARTLARDSVEQIVGKLAALVRGETVTGRVDLRRGY